MPSLYMVATPIGNLEDITLRALRILGEVGLIAAEDTRTTRKLLNHHNIKTPLTSYNEHNSGAKLPQLLEALKEKDVALVSDAGTPGISDPGQQLVQAAAEAGVPVVPLPGPSALTAALVVSGMPQGCLFLGFLPRRKSGRRKLWQSVAGQPFTLVAFESPHRLRASLEDALAVLGDRQVCVCRELTKLYEEVFRGTLSQALEHFQEPRGEFTLVIACSATRSQDLDPEAASEELRHLKGQGLKAREAVAAVVSSSGLPRSRVYRLWVDLGRK